MYGKLVCVKNELKQQSVMVFGSISMPNESL